MTDQDKKPTLSDLLKGAQDSVKKPITVDHNRLLYEKSPYLLHHAFQPIDWYPWSDEAFELAKKEDKPIFLSIGYSTCHWCHVMAKDSFEDHMIAQELNKNYVSIKVDREERPEIDAIYQKICQIMTQSGGWPLSIFMTPEGKPFYAATFIPKRRQGGRAGLMEILPQLADMWKNERDKLVQSAEGIYQFMGENLFVDPEAVDPSQDIFDEAWREYEESFDPEYGGFGAAPKFPSTHHLLFLMAYGHYERSAKAKEMVHKTLVSMAEGGIFDHIGGGFSRYSTDDKWLIPHFEKTLYDNALLLYTYATAYHRSKNSTYLYIAERTADYLLRDMMREDGGFYSGQDADVDEEEGKFYMLTPGEVNRVLGKDRGKLFMEKYGFTEEGNFKGANIPHLVDNEAYIIAKGEDLEDLEKLYEYRKSRYHLYTDDKILTSWNGLAMAGMAKIWEVTGEDKYLEAAQGAHTLILKQLKAKDGRLGVRYRNKDVLWGGTLEDYMFYAWGLFTLYQATFKAEYLVEFREIMDTALELFYDEENGGAYTVAKDGESLLFREKDLVDGALPSGNSMLAWLLYKLFVLTNEMKYFDVMEKQMSFVAGGLKPYPMNAAFGLWALLSYYQPSKEVICATTDFEDLGGLRQFIFDHPHPNTTICVKTESNANTLAETAPFMAAYPILTNGPKHFYYLCESQRCHDAVSSLEEMERLFKLDL